MVVASRAGVGSRHADALHGLRSRGARQCHAEARRDVAEPPSMGMASGAGAARYDTRFRPSRLESCGSERGSPARHQVRYETAASRPRSRRSSIGADAHSPPSATSCESSRPPGRRDEIRAGRGPVAQRPSRTSCFTNLRRSAVINLERAGISRGAALWKIGRRVS